MGWSAAQAEVENEVLYVKHSATVDILHKPSHRSHAMYVQKSRTTYMHVSWAELPGACYRKMPKSALKKEKCFDFTIESSIDFKKGQIFNKF